MIKGVGGSTKKVEKIGVLYTPARSCKIKMPIRSHTFQQLHIDLIADSGSMNCLTGLFKRALPLKPSSILNWFTVSAQRKP